MVLKFPYSSQNNPYSITLVPGRYSFELWGAEGGTWNTESRSGRGAYVKGCISLKTKTDLYVYVGEKGSAVVGKEGTAPRTFNGGGSGFVHPNTPNNAGSSGGGASDIRTVKGASWDSIDSLKSRIIVAAGGGGSASNGIPPTTRECNGGFGGSYEGGPGISCYDGVDITNAIGGYYNSSGGIRGIGKIWSGENGEFGKAGNGGTCYSTSGGGGGYYGGGGSGVSNNNHQCGAGGSSYVSGFHPTDFKELKFSYAKISPGNETIKEPNGIRSVGHVGDGYVKISIIENKEIKSCSYVFSFIHVIIFLIVS